MSDKNHPKESASPLIESDQPNQSRKMYFNTNILSADEIAKSIVDELFPELREHNTG